ncbi:hypothetical protein ACFQ23_08170 [Schaalia naturae]|uniref:Uncharacterized protein n=1 Tax=Schaalia naturae TaxID=635203 RepID=A0ABW2SS10_9ACTO
MTDTNRRDIRLATLAIPGHLVMAISKAGLLFFGFSAFLSANVLFNFGLAAIKVLVVVTDRRTLQTASPAAGTRALRDSGLIVVLLSGAYVLSCLPLALGRDTSPGYGKNVATAIAALAFTELGFSVHGVLSSRRRQDILMEAIKLSNLASSLVLVVLAQTALLSMTATDGVDPSRYNGFCGLVLGSLAALVGIHMVARSRTHRRLAEHSAPGVEPSAEPTAELSAGPVTVSTVGTGASGQT